MNTALPKLEQKLGFDRIRQMLAEACTNQLAVRMCSEMAFTDNYAKLIRELEQTDEMRQILMLENSFPNQDFIDLTPELERLKIGNTVIDLQCMLDLKVSLKTLTDCVRFLVHDNADKYPQLSLLARHVELNPAILRQIGKIVDEKGEIYDNASPLLQEIRHEMRRKQGEVDSQINKTLSRAKREGWAPENAEVTIRNGRMVIPMLDTHRRKIKGLIHDESATRQTAFLEPTEVVELNNDLRELTFAERHEINKILLKFSDMIRPELAQIINAYWVLARIDFVRAKARLALTLHCGLPIVSDVPQINWIEARHPILLMNAENQGRKVVPFSLQLDEMAKILIVSGPNAGGKSVCLKAVGLIQYMLQCGLLVPCRETSEMGIFGRLFIDIGDQQSIDDELSTYTSHLQNMKQLLLEADNRTLFLLDELGGGTEPRSGCAIAEAVLEELYGRGSFGVVTTHFADLKLLADHYEGIVNGAMLFDTVSMKPLYRLSIGHPGSSFAFEIAQNVGFPQEVLDAAGSKVGKEMLNFEHQLQQIELDKQEIARQRTELEVSDQFLSEVIQKYQNLTEKLESKKYEILSAARAEAKQILQSANKTVEQTISDIKTAQAEKEQTRAARERLKEQAAQVEEAQQAHTESRKSQRQKMQVADAAPKQQGEEYDDSPIVVGDIVKIEDQESFGEVVEVKGRKAVIESNSIRMTIALNRLRKTRKKHIPVDKTRRQDSHFQSIYDEINEKRKYFNPTLDLRGQRADEALSMLQHHIDEAMLLSEKELRILHGKGYGILKTIVREFLQGSRDVQSFHSEQMQLGGDGVTVVHLR